MIRLTARDVAQALRDLSRPGRVNERALRAILRSRDEDRTRGTR